MMQKVIIGDVHSNDEVEIITQLKARDTLAPPIMIEQSLRVYGAFFTGICSDPSIRVIL